MNVALTDDLQGLLRMKVENGQFPSEQAVIEEALRLFLTKEPDEEHARGGQEKGRVPGPFLEDEAAPAPGDLPRSGQEIVCLYLYGVTRQPGLFPGD
jgi:Arc/MetJ-type ribon-helix-helix transcriptional regulator